MAFVQEKSLALEKGLEVAEPQDDCQQLLVGDAVVSLWLAERVAVVGNDLLTLLPLLGQTVPRPMLLAPVSQHECSASWHWSRAVVCNVSWLPTSWHPSMVRLLVCCQGQHGEMKVTLRAISLSSLPL